MRCRTTILLQNQYATKSCHYFAVMIIDSQIFFKFRRQTSKWRFKKYCQLWTWKKRFHLRQVYNFDTEWVRGGNLVIVMIIQVSDSMRTAPEEVYDRANGKKGTEKSASEMTSGERKAGRKVFFFNLWIGGNLISIFCSVEEEEQKEIGEK